MSCSKTLKNCHYKSAQNAYNNSQQAFTATATPVNVLGVLNTDTGCSIDTNTAGFTVLNSGLYRISYDVTFPATAAGTATLQGVKDATPLLCMASSVTTAAGSVYTLHAETTIYIPVCCGGSSAIGATIGDVTGTISHVCASVVKLA